MEKTGFVSICRENTEMLLRKYYLKMMKRKKISKKKLALYSLYFIILYLSGYFTALFFVVKNSTY